MTEIPHSRLRKQVGCFMSHTVCPRDFNFFYFIHISFLCQNDFNCQVFFIFISKFLCPIKPPLLFTLSFSTINWSSKRLKNTPLYVVQGNTFTDQILESFCRLRTDLPSYTPPLETKLDKKVLLGRKIATTTTTTTLSTTPTALSKLITQT